LQSCVRWPVSSVRMRCSCVVCAGPTPMDVPNQAERSHANRLEVGIPRCDFEGGPKNLGAHEFGHGGRCDMCCGLKSERGELGMRGSNRCEVGEGLESLRLRLRSVLRVAWLLGGRTIVSRKLTEAASEATKDGDGNGPRFPGGARSVISQGRWPVESGAGMFLRNRVLEAK
jgi:hypothetical protein